MLNVRDANHFLDLLPLPYFSTRLALSLVHLPAGRYYFLAQGFYLPMPCATPDATLLQHLALLEQATAHSYACACHQQVPRTSQRWKANA